MPQAVQMTFDEQHMRSALANGCLAGVPWAWFPRLRDTTLEERSHYDISPRGLHWKALGEEVALAGLLSLMEKGRAPGVKVMQRGSDPSNRQGDGPETARHD